ncbi:MAG: response regulator [Dehalococcoidaceae bacterium]|nr:response regulator [Dehalococcoidaceae bacterium]
MIIYNTNMETKKQVLVVDDEQKIINLLRIKLRLHGYDVITTTSGAEAIEIIRTQQPDIVLLDILMPGVTGIEVLSAVRAFSQVPVVALTAKPDTIPLALKHGANASLSKPFDPDQVVKMIGTILNSSV